MRLSHLNTSSSRTLDKLLISLGLQLLIFLIVSWSFKFYAVHFLTAEEKLEKFDSRKKYQQDEVLINAGEGVEKREPSYTVGGNAN